MMMKKFLKWISFILLLLACIVVGLLIFQMAKLHVIPMKYFALLCVFLTLITFLVFFMSLKLPIIGMILLVVCIGISSLGNIYIYKTRQALKIIDQTDEEVVEYSLKTLKDSSNPIQKVGVLTAGSEQLQAKSLEKLGSSYEVIPYTSYIDFGYGLYNGEVDALLVSDQYKECLEEIHPEFEKDTKAVDSFQVCSKIRDRKTTADITKEPFNVYITGRDARAEGTSGHSRSDANILISVNPNTHQILMLGIPRDFYIPQTCQNNQKDKLTHTGMYGVACTVDSVENYLETPIDYYLEVNFKSLVQVVDSLGGITVHSPNDFVSKNNYHFVKGDNKMDGKHALSFARERKAFQDGDRERSRNQMRVLKAIIKRILSPSIVKNYPKLMEVLPKSFRTNFTSDEIASFVRLQLEDGKGWNMQQIQVKGSDDMVMSPAFLQELYVMVPYEDTVENAKVLIQKVMDGGTITDEDVEKQEEIINRW